MDTPDASSSQPLTSEALQRALDRVTEDFSRAHGHAQRDAKLRQRQTELIQLANMRLDRIVELEEQVARLERTIRESAWQRHQMSLEDYPTLTEDDFSKN